MLGLPQDSPDKCSLDSHRSNRLLKEYQGCGFALSGAAVVTGGGVTGGACGARALS